jgi:hypothetical protein
MEMETNLKKGYADALKAACAELAARDAAQICLNAAVSYNEDSSTYRVIYLDKVYHINAATGEVGCMGKQLTQSTTSPGCMGEQLTQSTTSPGCMGEQLTQSTTSPGEEVSATVKVLLLHYLIYAGNKPLSGKLVSFRELKNGAAIYYPTFYKRAIAPLIKAFGDCIENLNLVSKKISGIKEKYGHASMTIRVLPMVPVTFILWEGEEDVPPSGTILFDSSIESFLPAEDIVVAGSFGAYELIRLKNECKAIQQA